jgi:hypothetical protein
MDLVDEKYYKHNNFIINMYHKDSIHFQADIAQKSAFEATRMMMEFRADALQLSKENKELQLKNIELMNEIQKLKEKIANMELEMLMNK